METLRKKKSDKKKATFDRFGKNTPRAARIKNQEVRRIDNVMSTKN
jgi:hypothetical protein